MKTPVFITQGLEGNILLKRVVVFSEHRIFSYLSVYSNMWYNLCLYWIERFEEKVYQCESCLHTSYTH